MYHSIKLIEKSEVMKSLHVAPNAFKRQMLILKKLGFRGCSVMDAGNALRSGSTEKLVALTFDDGYANFYNTALPILDAHNFSATVFPVAGLVGKSNVWDTEKNNGISANPLMSWKQLHGCVDQGIEIGCHSMSHRSLIDPETDLESEVVNAKNKLANNLKINVETFCYPYGHYNNNIMNAVSAAGFSSAVTMIRARATDNDDLLQLPRIPITWHTLPHLFLVKLLTAYEDNRRNK